MPQRINYWRQVPSSGRTALEHFTPQMFVICMGTGILSVLLHQNSYQFRGLGIISIIMWLLDLLLYAIIFAVFIARWIVFPKSTATTLTSEFEETTSVSTAVIATATLVEMVSLVLGSTWSRWQYVSYACWWATVAFAVVTTVMTLMLLFSEQEVTLSKVTPNLVYPAIGLVATASCGSILVNYTTLDVTLSMPVIVVGLMLLGAGFLLALLSTACTFLRLLSHGTPPPKKIATQFIPIGALGNAVYSFSSYTYAAGPKREIFSIYGSGPVGETAIAQAIYGAGFLFSITIFGFATLWMILSLGSFAREIRKAEFSLEWWAAAYPIGAYGVACTQLAIDLNSTAFKVVASIVLVILVIFWLALMALTIPALVSGELLLKEVKQSMDKEKERKEEEQPGRIRTSGGSEATQV